MNWSEFRDAPPPGTVLARSEDVARGETRALTLGAFPALLVRGAAGLRAFVNACPHQFLPLDHRGARLLSADGAVLRCANHGAGFDAATGEGVEGLGCGETLARIPIEETPAGDIVVSEGET